MDGAATAEAHAGDRDPRWAEDPRKPLSPLHVGIIVWLASDVMFFAGFFAAWFVLRAENSPWPPSGVELDVVRSGVFTLVLVVSSFTIHRSVKDAERGDRSGAIGWLVTTFVLGGVFLVNQLLEYASLDFGFTSHAYGSIYYLLTGFHAAHVFAGLILMLSVLALVVPATSRAPTSGTVSAFSYYWHFVDVVWVLVFTVVYLIA